MAVIRDNKNEQLLAHENVTTLMCGIIKNIDQLLRVSVFLMQSAA